MANSVLEVRQARREGVRIVIGLAGVSGSGKTVTALMLAYGLANYDPTKIGFIDTENRRGSLNADIFQKVDPPSKAPFLIGDLFAPFSPQRYIEAIKIFEQEKIEVLIIDSASHAWEGPGGCQDIAGEENKYWNRAKKEHKRFVTAALQCDMHVIICFRAREKVEMERREVDGKMKTVYTDMGLQPITEKNVMFDMTASLMMHDRGLRQDVLKPIDELINVMGREKGYLTPKDGKDIRDWVGGAKQLDPTVERFRNRLISNTEGGVTHITECWNKTPEVVQTALGDGFKKTLIASATAYDKAKADAEDAEKDASSNAPAAATSTAAAIMDQAKKGKKAAADAASSTPASKTEAEATAPAKVEPEPAAKAAAEQPAPAPATPAAVVQPTPAAAVQTAPVPAAAPKSTPAAGTLEEPMF
jgi:hypothetical protein